MEPLGHMRGDGRIGHRAVSTSWRSSGKSPSGMKKTFQRDDHTAELALCLVLANECLRVMLLLGGWSIDRQNRT